MKKMMNFYGFRKNSDTEFQLAATKSDKSMANSNKLPNFDSDQINQDTNDGI